MNTARFSSKIGTVLTLVGVAVGLGNVWRFPYMMGSYGGSAFLIIYLLFTLLFAFPALMTEMALGKRTGKGTVVAFREILGPKWGQGMGYFLLGVVTIAGSYYAVVVGNVCFTAFFSMTRGFQGPADTRYGELLQNGPLQYVIILLLVMMALGVIHRGMTRGIERVSTWVMPFFALSVLYLIAYTLTIPGALEQLFEFLKPDPEAIGAPELFAALGQAFFSVGLGGTFVVVYSGFIRDRESIPKMALFTCLGDLGSSLLVSLFLVPAVLVLGLNMKAGPGLIFHTLPGLFGTIPSGRFVGSLFLLALSLVAFLSLVAAYQVPVSSLEKMGVRVSKKRLVIVLGIIQAVLILPNSLYPDLIGILDLIFGSGMQVFGSMIAIVGVWWGVRHRLRPDLLTGQSCSPLFRRLGLFWLRWIIPLTLLSVLVGYVYNRIG